MVSIHANLSHHCRHTPLSADVVRAEGNGFGTSRLFVIHICPTNSAIGQSLLTLRHSCYIVARFLRSIPHSDTPQVDLTYKSLLWIVIVPCAPFFPFLPMLILKTFSVPEMFALQGWLVSLLALQAIIIHRIVRFARFQRQNIIHGNLLW
ncbi:unnamed protein product, partial [Mesorhabditis spiculigera]